MPDEDASTGEAGTMGGAASVTELCTCSCCCYFKLFRLARVEQRGTHEAGPPSLCSVSPSAWHHQESHELLMNEWLVSLATGWGERCHLLKTWETSKVPGDGSCKELGALCTQASPSAMHEL